VHAQDLLAPLQVGITDCDLTIEAARAQQRSIQDVSAVGRGDDDYAVGSREAVHFNQQLIECLLALFMTE
jgi:hypothetical protein